ncbi:MAG: GC-type dockerin domain-anchored protein, partial [Planctomycetota bacterium]
VALDGQNTGLITVDDAILAFSGGVFAQRLQNTTVDITNGGIVRAISGNADLENVTFNGPSVGVTRQGFRFFGSFFANNGTMTLSGDGVNGFSALRISATPYALDGTGEIVLDHPPMTNPGAAPTISQTIADAVLTNGANHTVRGKYRVTVEMINEGTMTADNAGETVEFVGAPLENRGTLRATNDGILQLANDTIQTGSGGIELDGGFFDFGGVGGGVASLTGGSIVGSNGGKLRIQTANGAFESVTINADTDLLGQLLVSLGGNVNNGSMLLQLDEGNFGILRFDEPQTWDGTGEIVLNADANNLLSRAQVTRQTVDDPIVHSATHTMRGTGVIGAAIDNRGLITADVPGRILLLQLDDKRNAGIIRADGGILEIAGNEIDQTDAGNGPGRMEAVNGGTLLFDPAAVVGGTIDATDGFAIADGGQFDSFEDIELFGDLQVQTSNAEMIGSITNHGRVILNSTATGVGVLEVSPGFLFDGSGVLRFNGVSTPNDAQLGRAAGVDTTVTNGPDHTFEGQGRLVGVELINQGTIAPGRGSPGIGAIEMTAFASIVCEPTSRIEIEVEGPDAGQFDLIANAGGNSATFHCDGRLALSNVNGFTGLAEGEFIDIIFAPIGLTGTFDTVSYSGQVNYEVLYLPDRVRVAFDCKADTNNDGTVSPADFNAWVLAFNTNAPECDQNNDGACSPADFNAWVLNFNAGC